MDEVKLQFARQHAAQRNLEFRARHDGSSTARGSERTARGMASRAIARGILPAMPAEGDPGPGSGEPVAELPDSRT